MIRAFRPVLLVVTMATAAAAAGPSVREKVVDPAAIPRIDRAVAKGLDWLRERQAEDGSWYPQSAFRRETRPLTALVLHTLLRCGEPPDSGAIRKGFEWVLSTETKRWFGRWDSQCWPVLALCERARREERRLTTEEARWVRTLVGFILSGQRENGGFGVTDDDAFSTLLALRALRAARAAGTTVPIETFERVLPMLEAASKEIREGDGAPDRRLGPTARMAFLIAGLKQVEETLPGEDCEELRRRAAGTAGAGLDWLAEHYPVAKRPRDWRVNHLWLLGVEQAGTAARVERIGKQEWYEEEAIRLIEDQADDGFLYCEQTGDARTNADGYESQAFALLFLVGARPRPAVTEPPGAGTGGQPAKPGARSR